ncbi:MAG: competence protein ComEA helix-hairpin-helix repeat protein [Myxococcaceae bacterium]|nr:competence protein ComEA helix-hairpin-helix repeat protein [Myxococcaceae bacterium]
MPRLIPRLARARCRAALLLALLLPLALAARVRADAAASAALPADGAVCPAHCQTACQAHADADAPEAAQPVDLNSADETALLELPGIGPARARAILEFRRAHGAFRSVSQLLHIKGIGRALLRQLRPRVTLSGAPGP